MSISEKDIKLLWGRAAGICSYPGCGQNCIQFLDLKDPTLIGEMAHIISKSLTGPRGGAGGGHDGYSNLILLCPTHHTLVDKAHESFPEENLLQWKADHEAFIQRRLAAPAFPNKRALCGAVLRLLIENHAAWRTYGPDSQIALENPISNMAGVWTFRKLSQVIPNNTRIVAFVRANADLFSAAEYALCAEFAEHATGFEISTYERRDNVPRFPTAFERMIRNGAEEK